uniref:SiaC family regulatory phosphoprotein domain-containing protein n=1 Tax=Magnetococcus massalia (strain MO-1) TaxID=451514 RepID=A0A1S7LIQ2_MAGMO|nr:conserved protein of unknown function [Candidatus Magnetococcus massalia]
MDTIKIEKTERSPEIEFVFPENRFALRGESYPEDVPAFYGPHISALGNHLESLEEGEVTFDFELIYFNSTSAKVIMNLFETLDEAAERGVTVTINWHFEEDDDNMEELGEEFGEDLESATFNLCPKAE